MIRWAWLNYWLWEVAWCCCQKPSVHFCKAILSMALLHDVMRLLNVTRYRLTSVSKVSQRSFWLLLCFREHLYLSIKILWKEIHFIFHTYIYCKFNITHLYSACTRVLLHHHQLCALPHIYIIINAHVQWIVRCDNLWRILLYHFPITFDLNYHSCFLIRFQLRPAGSVGSVWSWVWTLVLQTSGTVVRACNSSSWEVIRSSRQHQIHSELRSSWDRYNPVPQETNQNRNQLTVGLATLFLDTDSWRRQRFYGAASLKSREVKGKNAPGFSSLLLYNDGN